MRRAPSTFSREGDISISERIARIDVERVIEEVDVSTLQSILESLAFSDLDARDMSVYPRMSIS